MHFIRCIPHKRSNTCYYLDSTAVMETNLDNEQKEMLGLIPDVPKGRDWFCLYSNPTYVYLYFWNAHYDSKSSIFFSQKIDGDPIK